MKWTDEKTKLLGTMPDRELAEKLGTTQNIVMYRRHKLGIPAYGSQGGSGKVEWTKAMIKMLGTAPDMEIGERLGMSHRTVGNKREQLGIPSFREYRSWTPEEDAVLGTMLDRKAAEVLGRGEANVRRRRLELKIPAHGRITRDPDPKQETRDKKAIGAAIRKARKAMGYSVVELADALVFTESALRGYENGDRYPSLKALIEMARMLEVKPSELLRDVD